MLDDIKFPYKNKKSVMLKYYYHNYCLLEGQEILCGTTLTETCINPCQPNPQLPSLTLTVSPQNPPHPSSPPTSS